VFLLYYVIRSRGRSCGPASFHNLLTSSPKSTGLVFKGPENHRQLDVSSKSGVKWYRKAEDSSTRIHIDANCISNNGPVHAARMKLTQDNTALSVSWFLIDDNTIRKIVHWLNNGASLLCFITVLYCRGVFCSRWPSASCGRSYTGCKF
jgi:hypothetical protein